MTPARHWQNVNSLSTTGGAHQSEQRRAKKRTRSGYSAQGPSQSRLKRDASEDDTNEQDEKVLTNEIRYDFHLGDMAGLRKFFRQRIEELTMKPVRGLVTNWIKQLEPKRPGVYGPYHRKKPSEMPEEATPPWWPQDVGYIEPAHLDKNGTHGAS